MWIVVIIAVAMYFAAKAGIPAAGRAIGEAWHNRGENGRIWSEKRRAKKQLVSDAVDSGLAPVSTKAGTVAGVATGAVVSGARLTFAAFLRAWKEGWQEGTERAEARRDAVLGVSVDDENAADSSDEGNKGCVHQVPDGVGFVLKCGKPTVEGKEVCPKHLRERYPGCVEPVIEGDDVRCCGEPKVDGSDLCRQHLDALEEARRKETEARTAPAVEDGKCSLNIRNREKGITMPVETAGNGGEIVTYDQFIASIDASLIEARSDREEAAVKVKTTEANLKITDQQAAALTKLSLPKEVVDAIKATRDSRAAKVRSAQDELKASELEITQLTIALNAATNNPQQQFYRG